VYSHIDSSEELFADKEGCCCVVILSQACGGDDSRDVRDHEGDAGPKTPRLSTRSKSTQPQSRRRTSDTASAVTEKDGRGLKVQDLRHRTWILTREEGDISTSEKRQATPNRTKTNSIDSKTLVWCAPRLFSCAPVPLCPTFIFWDALVQQTYHWF
jgi:hypothetical protein